MSNITAATKRKALEIIRARFDEVKDSDEVKRAIEVASMFNRAVDVGSGVTLYGILHGEEMARLCVDWGTNIDSLSFRDCYAVFTGPRKKSGEFQFYIGRIHHRDFETIAGVVIGYKAIALKELAA